MKIEIYSTVSNVLLKSHPLLYYSNWDNNRLHFIGHSLPYKDNEIITAVFRVKSLKTRKNA